MLLLPNPPGKPPTLSMDFALESAYRLLLYTPTDNRSTKTVGNMGVYRFTRVSYT